MNGCSDPPTSDEPYVFADMPCPECGGDDARRSRCKACNGEGFVILAECPLNLIDQETREGLQSVRMAKMGMPPVDGGAINNTESFLQTFEAVELYDSLARAKVTNGK